MNTTDDIHVPMLMLGLTMLIATGFFVAAKDWVQKRVSGGSSSTPQSGPPESRGNPKDTPQPPLGSTTA